MINRVKVEGFKCFSSETTIEMSQITACTGMNSVGKSTLIQAILLAWESHNAEKSIPLNTSMLNLGSTSQIMPSGVMKIEIDETSFQFEAGKDMLSLRLVNSLALRHPFVSRMPYYLNAERQGPRNYQKMQSHDVLHCGYYGEHTFDVVEKDPHLEISPKRRRKAEHVNEAEHVKNVPHLLNQIEYWMSYIVNGVQIKFSKDVSTQLAHMQIGQPDFDTGFSSPHNFGFGISYVLPIIVTGLIAAEDTLFIVENPEAHLHPAGQSRIGEFLAQISRDKVQVVVETHSEHVLNGIRKYALRDKLSPDDICINYFAFDGHTKKHSVKRLRLNDSMDILEWPEGFFDQEMIDLKELRLMRGRT